MNMQCCVCGKQLEEVWNEVITPQMIYYCCCDEHAKEVEIQFHRMAIPVQSFVVIEGTCEVINVEGEQIND